MLNLPTIQTGVTAGLDQNASPLASPQQCGASGDPFDQIMNQIAGLGGDDQKPANATPPQTSDNELYFQSDSLNGTQYGLPLQVAQPAVTTTGDSFVPVPPVNPDKSLPFRTIAEPQGNTQTRANKAVAGASIKSVATSLASAKTPIGSKGQKSAGSDVGKHSSPSAKNASPPPQVLTQCPLPEISSALVSEVILSSASALESDDLKSSPPGSTKFTAQKLAPPGTDIICSLSRTPATKITPAESTVAEPLKSNIGADSPAVDTGAPLLTKLAPNLPTDPKTQAASAPGMDKIPSAAVANGQMTAMATNPEAALLIKSKPVGSSTNLSALVKPANSTRSQTSIADKSPPISDGTPSALSNSLMNNGGKLDKSAEPGRQFLPGSTAVVAHGTDLSTGTSQAAVSLGANDLSSKASPAPEIQNYANRVESNLSLDAERTHDLVTTHAMRLDSAGNSSLTVIIKPSAGTQMSLELRQQNNAIQAQASLQQGDFKHLSQNWPELQHRLEQRGIRLAPLTDDGSSTFTSNSGQGDKSFGRSNPQASERLVTTSFGTGTTATTTPTAPSMRGKLGAGWETWA
jgi:hypothetical protein